MKIGPYEIRRYDNLNLQLIKHVEREIKTQQVADMINGKHGTQLELGDFYSATDEIGFYPKLEMALTRILDDKLLKVSDFIEVAGIINEIQIAKDEIIEACRGCMILEAKK